MDPQIRFASRTLFTCISTPSSHSTASTLFTLAREFSPRVERAGPGCVVFDASGLVRLVGDARAIGNAITDTARVRGFDVRVALASTSTAARLAVAGFSGVTVIPPGQERSTLAGLPLRVLEESSRSDRSNKLLDLLIHWGLRTVGDLAALPAADLFERLGEAGVRLQRLARGEDGQPLVPERDGELFEASIALEWPLEALESLSFVIARLLDPLADRLERAGVGAVRIETRLRLTTREIDRRHLELPTPMRNPRVMRTLILLDLEARRPSAGIDEVTIHLEPARSRVVQGSLLERPLPPPEQVATLVARLTALLGKGRCGAAVLVDSHAPDVFRMGEFEPEVRGRTVSHPLPLMFALRRFRPPRPIRVRMMDNRPVYVSVGRSAVGSGRVVTCAGPWRTSGHWWVPTGFAERCSEAGTRAKIPPSKPNGAYPGPGKWHREEWDVALVDGAVHRLYRDCALNRWFLEGIID